jgi:hypothetical protein
LAKNPSEVNAKFFNIINSEDWDIPEVDTDPTIVRDLFLQGDIPLGAFVLPTPLPGVWFSISMGFEIENPDEDDKDARW